jgi:hypothetical protein
MKRVYWLALIALISAVFPIVSYAIVDWYEVGIVWTPGAGQKPMSNCANGYYAFALQNVDLSSNTVRNDMKCGNISDYVPAGVNFNHANCLDVSVTWFGGAGEKPWAFCPNGKYAVGFSIYDYGNRNEGINKMRCCSLAGLYTSHTSSYQTTVNWFGGAGPKGYTECGYGSLITGVQLKDYGGNNQAVYQMRCSYLAY